MKSRKDFVKEMVESYNELTTSDLQGIVMARCMQTDENEDDLLDEIYERVEND